MSSSAKCLKFIDDYFTQQLKQGLTVPEVIETFKHPVLPYDLKTDEFTEDSIRRCAQLVSTRRIIKYNEENQNVMDI
jgi:hypothetical protein